MNLKNQTLKRTFAVLTFGGMAGGLIAGPVDYNRDVRPILSDKCYHCHGPDADNQSSEFRVDSKEAATADLGGYSGVVSGAPDQSEFIKRITTEDEDDLMPPPDSNRSLTADEKETLRRWIAEGAEFDTHWSFKPPVKTVVPPSVDPIDHFVRDRLKETGLKPSGRANKHQLIRRVTLALTGLPPTPEEVESFVSDESSTAFESVVDRLLASPAYGERMAEIWLDASRYADSAGYQNDFKRSQWPWRDWVIDAYNRNLPFDQFSIEQLAGDMLPDADEQTRLATAFNRNHRINNEGGIIPDEFLVEYVADRVETTSTVWLGLTVGCSRCHDHKYDPITMKDYYSLFSFFHNVPEKGKDGAIAPAPNMSVYTGTGTPSEHSGLKATRDRLQKELRAYPKNHADEFVAWLEQETKRVSGTPGLVQRSAQYHFDETTGRTLENLVAPKEKAALKGRARQVRLGQAGRFGKGLSISAEGFIQLGSPSEKQTIQANEKRGWSFFIQPLDGAIGEMITHVSKQKTYDGYRISLIETGKGDKLGVAFRLMADKSKSIGIDVRTGPILKRRAKNFSHLTVTYDGLLKAEGVKIYVDGLPVETHVISDSLEESFPITGAHLLGSDLGGAIIDELNVFHGELPSTEAIEALASMSAVSAIIATENPTKTQTAFIKKNYFETKSPGHKKLAANLARTEKQLKAFESANLTQVSIMEEMSEPRDTYLLLRGAYDQPDKSEILPPRTFSRLPAMEESFPRNRLGLAKWLFQKENPLTARVAVNRYWQMLFGVGLVMTPEDFGSQGAAPSHPRLLDWLAVEFRENEWNVKDLIKQIVMSETYCQDSRVTQEMLEKDPNNELLARGSRRRLSAFAIRDQALAASGLLIDRIGGPPVMPYQPEGLWEEVSAKGFKYQVAKDEGLYRRSLYTFWRRTVPPPSMMNFDSAGREVCSVNVKRTNTPLQAMNMLNDPQFVEAARSLGERLMKEEDSVESRIQLCSQIVLGRPASSREMKVFLKGFKDYLAEYENNAEAAQAIISIGHSTPDSNFAPEQLAAYTALASVFLNLDEAVTQE